MVLYDLYYVGALKKMHRKCKWKHANNLTFLWAHMNKNISGCFNFRFCMKMYTCAKRNCTSITRQKIYLLVDNIKVSVHFELRHRAQFATNLPDYHGALPKFRLLRKQQCTVIARHEMLEVSINVIVTQPQSSSSKWRAYADLEDLTEW